MVYIDSFFHSSKSVNIFPSINVRRLGALYGKQIIVFFSQYELLRDVKIVNSTTVY